MILCRQPVPVLNHNFFMSSGILLWFKLELPGWCFPCVPLRRIWFCFPWSRATTASSNSKRQYLHPDLASPNQTNPSLWASSCAPVPFVVFQWSSYNLFVSFVLGKLKIDSVCTVLDAKIYLVHWHEMWLIWLETCRISILFWNDS